MKKLAILLIAIGGLLSGCVTHDGPHGDTRDYHGDRAYHHEPYRGDRDRDDDGVPNRWDRHPDNPYRN
jgi:hypothetical protein